MSEDDQTPAHRPGEEAAEQEPARPHRVIGTPPPAVARSMLGGGPETSGASGPRTLLDTEDGGGRGGARREIEPADPAQAKRAERWVAAFFILSMLASIGFIAAYIGLPAGSVTKVFHSNLALGSAMTVAFLAVGAGAVIWVRRLMPDVEIAEERHPLASAPADRQAFE
jgi:ubiquinol-cytochrome c reductase iron-sulfur subunit